MRSEKEDEVERTVAERGVAGAKADVTVAQQAAARRIAVVFIIKGGGRERRKR
jgi:hypothetical protein